MREACAGQQLEAWFIAVGDEPEDVARFIADLHVQLPVYLDPDGAAIRALLPPEFRGVEPLPVAMNVLLDGDGRILLRRVRGEADFDPEMRDIADLLRKLAGP